MFKRTNRFIKINSPKGITISSKQTLREESVKLNSLESSKVFRNKSPFPRERIPYFPPIIIESVQRQFTFSHVTTLPQKLCLKLRTRSCSTQRRSKGEQLNGWDSGARRNFRSINHRLASIVEEEEEEEELGVWNFARRQKFLFPVILEMDQVYRFPSPNFRLPVPFVVELGPTNFRLLLKFLRY